MSLFAVGTAKVTPYKQKHPLDVHFDLLHVGAAAGLPARCLRCDTRYKIPANGPIVCPVCPDRVLHRFSTVPAEGMGQVSRSPQRAAPCPHCSTK